MATAVLGGTPMFTGFDGGNPMPVVKALHERFPEKPLLCWRTLTWISSAAKA